MNVQLVSLIVRTLRDYAGSEDLAVLDYQSLRSTYPEAEEEDLVAVLMLVGADRIDPYSFIGSMNSKDKEWFAECALEGLHSSLDGWEHEQQVVIELFLIDMCMYVQGARDMKL